MHPSMRWSRTLRVVRGIDEVEGQFVQGGEIARLVPVIVRRAEEKVCAGIRIFGGNDRT